MFSSSLRTTTSSTVRLNVYDLHQANAFVEAMGFGLYHSGVEIDGREYVFGSGQGIGDVPPRTAPNAVFRASIDMGSYDGGARGVARAIDDLRASFPNNGYDLVGKNCNHFSDALVFALLKKHIPAWRSFAGAGYSLAPSTPPRIEDRDGDAAAAKRDRIRTAALRRFDCSPD
ncbi:Lys63-specific deubiquitinase [Aureococcus anophagefferens]|nr:Lys63-specific deubiquitinase [Aureococcus anophagefferens]